MNNDQPPWEELARAAEFGVNVVFLRIGEGFNELALGAIILLIVRGMSRPAAAFSLQSVTERFRRLPCLGSFDERGNKVR